MTMTLPDKIKSLIERLEELRLEYENNLIDDAIDFQMGRLDSAGKRVRDSRNRAAIVEIKDKISELQNDYDMVRRRLAINQYSDSGREMAALNKEIRKYEDSLDNKAKGEIDRELSSSEPSRRARTIIQNLGKQLLRNQSDVLYTIFKGLTLGEHIYTSHGKVNLVKKILTILSNDETKINALSVIATELGLTSIEQIISEKHKSGL